MRSPRRSAGVALELDLLDRAATDEVLASVGHVDVLVNNAGIAESASLEKTTDELWDRIMELDATAPFRVDPRARAGHGQGGVGPRDQHRLERGRLGLRLHRRRTAPRSTRWSA